MFDSVRKILKQVLGLFVNPVIHVTWILTALGMFGTMSTSSAASPKALHSTVADTSLAGSWEGEYHVSRRPYFMTLHLKHSEENWSGSIEVLGQTHNLEKVEKTENGVRCVLVPGPDGIFLDTKLDNNQLSGFLIESDNQYPLELNPVPVYPEPENREQAWHQDLKALADRFLKFDRSFTTSEQELFRAQVRDLHDGVSELNDSEIIVRMASAVALADNAHTRLYLLRNRTELRRLPIRLWWFSDGLYVVRAKSSHKNLLGCQVNEIEGMPVRLVRNRVSSAFAGNSSWVDYKSVYYMTSPEILHGFNIASDPENIEFGFSQCRNSPFTHTIEPLPLKRSTDPVEAWWDLSPNHHEKDWIQVLKKSNVSPPLYLRYPHRPYWFEYIGRDNLMYFQYNRSSEMSDESMSEFSERLIEELEKRAVDTFVVDLRFNTGGDLNLAKDLMVKLKQRTEHLARFVIPGRATFSAGITHAASWMEDGNVNLIGEPVGDELDFWSEGGNIILPNSGLAAHFANGFHSYSKKPCPKDVPCILDLNSPNLQPDVLTGVTWTEYMSGSDNALNTIRYDRAEN